MSKTVTIRDFKTFSNMAVIIKKENWAIPEGGIKPIIECPKCGCGILGDTAPHGITKDGTVYASVVCQNENCDFHSNVILENWDLGEIPHN